MGSSVTVPSGGHSFIDNERREGEAKHSSSADVAAAAGQQLQSIWQLLRSTEHEFA